MDLRRPPMPPIWPNEAFYGLHGGGQVGGGMLMGDGFVVGDEHDGSILGKFKSTRYRYGVSRGRIRVCRVHLQLGVGDGDV